VTDLETYYPPIEVSTQPTRPVVTVKEAKAYCDYDDDDRDGQFERWIATATQQVEAETERAICGQTCKLYLPYFPCVIEIHKLPVPAVSSVTYLDAAGATQTLATSVYQSNLKRTPPRIMLAENQTWPTTQCGTDNAVTVTFTAGWDGTGTAPVWWPMAQEAVLIRVKRSFDGCGGDMSGDMPYQGVLSALQWKRFV
jgi:uncharacterized phiE125 gp8 family phage protein